MKGTIAITGIRDLARSHLAVVDLAVAELVGGRPDAVLFGGARGTDTVALAAAWAALQGVRPPRLIVIVPARLRDQPPEARAWARRCADEIVELKAPALDRKAYHARNAEMVRRADGLLAFWDGRAGGTQRTIELAEDARIPVETVRLLGGVADDVGTEDAS